MQAFEEVCPERIDLIHKNFRKLCNLVADVDEWGQVTIVNMLTRYSRTQFVDPNIIVTENTEKVEENSNESDDDENSSFIMDPDHRLLLRSMKPLLQSRNSAVKIYFFL
jgi:AP-3 complex subunit beta